METALPLSALRGRVHVWLDWEPLEVARLEQLIEEFRTYHPAVEFALTYITPTELVDAYLGARREGTEPSMLMASSRQGAELWRKGLLLDVTDRVTQDLRERAQVLAWSQAMADGHVFGVPVDLEAVLLFRNRARVEQAPGTLDEMVAMAASGGKVPRTAPVIDLGFMYSGGFASACGGELVTEENFYAFDGPAGLCWINLLRSLSRMGPVGYNSEEDNRRFQAGDSVWLLESSTHLNRLESALGSDILRVDPWPVYDDTGLPLAGYVWTRNAFLSSDLTGDDLEATWAFAMYLLSPDAQRLLSGRADIQRLPVLHELALGDPLLESALKVSDKGVALPLIPDLPRLGTALERAVSAVLTSGAVPNLALRRAVLELKAATQTPAP